MNETEEFAGDKQQQREKASKPILSAIEDACTAFREWNTECDLIDTIYSKQGNNYEALKAELGGSSWEDAQMDLFWSSTEVLKPAIYAKPPVPAVAAMFNDGGSVKDTTAELLERSAISTFKRTGIGEVMCSVRDDLIFENRGVMWLRYESDGGKKVCVEHLLRDDFLHEPARKWSEVGWVAGGFWLSRDEMKKRFKLLTDQQLDDVKFTKKRDKDASGKEYMASKAKVWEVWHRANNRVYWVTDGLDVYLDDAEPHLKLEGFFPCPRPAYGTLVRKTLIPVPDFKRYASTFTQINRLTSRIYLLLNQVKMKGLIPGGGDVGDAVKRLMAEDDDQLLIPVPGAALMEQGQFVVWLPLEQLASTIAGLIESRRQLVSDFYELSGISDIMRGATEAEETLGAQQMKAQYGSVRVRCKIDELQRLAADAVKIASEILAEKFDGETLLEMSQMELPTRKDIEKRIKEIETAAEKELDALAKRAEQMGQEAQGQVDPQQAQAMLAQEQQAILSKYGPMLEEAENLVPIDDVVDLLRDDRARSFAFEIETDSTILTDELAEKQSRADFITAFNGATQGLMSIAAMGEVGAALAGEMLKFSLAPYRAGRQLSSAIDEFVKQAPAMIAAQQAEGGDEGLGELAEAEKLKAQAAIERVQAQRESDQAEFSRKMQELQQKAESDRMKLMAEAEKLRQANEKARGDLKKQEAEINNLNAQTATILNKLGIDWARLDLDVDKARSEEAARVRGEQRQIARDTVEDGFRERSEIRADMTAQGEEQ